MINPELPTEWLLKGRELSLNIATKQNRDRPFSHVDTFCNFHANRKFKQKKARKEQEYIYPTISQKKAKYFFCLFKNKPFLKKILYIMHHKVNIL